MQANSEFTSATRMKRWETLVVIAFLCVMTFIVNFDKIRMASNYIQIQSTRRPFEKRQGNICTKDERIRRLRHKCQNVSSNFQSLTKEQQLTVARNTFVDMKHKLIACLVPKTGCTTWKAILANNTFAKPLSDDYPVKKLHYGYLQKFNIKQLVEFNATMIKSLLHDDTYYKFLVVRHPFDRIYSAYVNKFVSNLDIEFSKEHGSQILRQLRPNLTKNEAASGEGITFKEFIKFTQLPVGSNHHWDPIERLCQPCYIHYNQVIKTESMDHDNNDVISKHLAPYHRGLNTAHNVVLGTGEPDVSFSASGHQIAAYQDLDPADLDSLAKKYHTDLDYYGYEWRLGDNRTMYTTCRHGALADDRLCC